MEMSIKDLILVKHDIGNSLSALRKYIIKRDLNVVLSELETAESDFQLMCNCMMKGYKDPQLGDVYNALLHRVFRLYGNVRMESVVRKRPTFMSAKKMSIDIEANHSEIKNVLEEFVQEVAIGTLLNDQQPNSQRDVYLRHQRYMDTLFCSILVSRQWSENTSAFMSQLILTPTIDQNDALTLVSAVTLSLMTVFDVEKWKMLLSVFENSVVESLRQRAFVGWVLGAPTSEIHIFPEVENVLENVLGRESVCEELLQLQLQLFYCANAESDNERIKSEIMPTLIKNSNLRAFGSGFIEREDEFVHDELSSENTDAEIEKMELTMARMMDMQKTGIDIYYGGFSQMKRFRFFGQLSNWFAPFSSDHIDLQTIVAKLGNKSFLENLMKNGSFCDSDKYSFVFAIASVIDKLPDNIKKMLVHGEALGTTISTEQKESAAYIRRTYMQDLFRFFNLYQNRDDFDNPFAFKNGIIASFFFANPLFSNGYIAKKRLGLIRFLYRRKLYSHILYLWNNIHDATLFAVEEKCIVALAYLKLGNYIESRTLLESLPKSSSDLIILRGLAKACFALRDYDRSEYYYEQLVKLIPDNLHNQLGLAVSQLNNGNTEKGMQILFRLNYENPDNINVMRSLAWGYLLSRRASDAIILYDKLLAIPEVANADILSAAYANWFLMKTENAVNLFRRYINRVRRNSPNHLLVSDFNEDKRLLNANNITEQERNVMEYIVEKGMDSCEK